MASPPTISRLEVSELDGDDGTQRLADVLNEFMTSTRHGLENRLTLTENVAAQWHTTNYLYVPSEWTTVGASGAPQYLNGFGPWGDPTTQDQKYRKTADGQVHLLGLIKLPAVLPGPGTAVYQLPLTHAPTVSTLADTSNHFQIRADGMVEYEAGGGAPSSVLPLNFLFPAKDPAPIPWANPYIFALDENIFRVKPTGVILTEVREKSANASVAAGTPDWDYTFVGGKPHIKIRNIPGLPSERYYQFTFLVIAS